MRIVEFRRARGITQEDFAKRLGISRVALSRIEGGGGCRLRTLIRLIAITGGLVRADDLLAQARPDGKDGQDQGESDGSGG